MQIAITGATGFLGRYIVSHLVAEGHRCRCWARASSDRGGIDADAHAVTWVEGELGNRDASRELVQGCDAVVHAALYRPGAGFRGAEGDLIRFVEVNVVGTLALIEAARKAGAKRFIFISSCAVHEQILDDRPLDEAHPLWPLSHYGAHKAAIEAFVHSYGLGEGYAIAALRPTGIYGLAHPPQRSKWFDLVGKVVRGEAVECRGGGKEVHAADVARAVGLLLKADADSIAGQAYNCYDRYISNLEVANLAKAISGSRAEVRGQTPKPKHQIETGKITALGMTFAGESRLEQTVRQLVEAAGQAGSSSE